MTVEKTINKILSAKLKKASFVLRLLGIDLTTAQVMQWV